jgi:hypothetical protein
MGISDDQRRQGKSRRIKGNWHFFRKAPHRQNVGFFPGRYKYTNLAPNAPHDASCAAKKMNKQEFRVEKAKKDSLYANSEDRGLVFCTLYTIYTG